MSIITKSQLTSLVKSAYGDNTRLKYTEKKTHRLPPCLTAHDEAGRAASATPSHKQSHSNSVSPSFEARCSHDSEVITLSQQVKELQSQNKRLLQKLRDQQENLEACSKQVHPVPHKPSDKRKGPSKRSSKPQQRQIAPPSSHEHNTEDDDTANDFVVALRRLCAQARGPRSEKFSVKATGFPSASKIPTTSRRPAPLRSPRNIDLDEVFSVGSASPHKAEHNRGSAVDESLPCASRFVSSSFALEDTSWLALPRHGVQSKGDRPAAVIDVEDSMCGVSDFVDVQVDGEAKLMRTTSYMIPADDTDL